MARIRTIKPEFWTDEKVVELSAFARLLFIGLWNFCDDEGRMIYSPKRIKMQIFPADDVDCAALVLEVQSSHLLSIYSVDGVEYLQVAGFAKHQKIDKRLSSKYPAPPLHPDLLSFSLDNTDSPRLSPTNTDSPRLSPIHPDGMEGNGMEGNGLDSEAPPVVRLSLFEFRQLWRDVFGQELGGGVNESVRDACKNYSAAHIRDVITRMSTLLPLPKNPYAYFSKVLHGVSVGSTSGSGVSDEYLAYFKLLELEASA